jgi:hypothetical protein
VSDAQRAVYVLRMNEAVRELLVRALKESLGHMGIDDQQRTRAILHGIEGMKAGDITTMVIQMGNTDKKGETL